MAVFDIIIPTYNNLDELIKCLKCLEKQTFLNFRAIICIDGSTDGTVEYFEHYLPDFQIIIAQHSDKKNRGRNPARNLALPYIASELVLFLDSDIELLPDALQCHYDLLLQQDCVSVGDVQYANARNNIWADYLQTRGKNKYLDKAEIPARYLITQNTAHRSKYFVELGGQDTAITQYGGGDTEYALRLYQRYQLPTVFNAQARGDSEMNKTVEIALAQMEKFGSGNLKYLSEKFPDVKDIFGLKYFTDNSFSSVITRSLLRYKISKIIEKLLPAIPPVIRRYALHYCVAARIKRGFLGY